MHNVGTTGAQPGDAVWAGGRDAAASHVMHPPREPDTVAEALAFAAAQGVVHAEARTLLGAVWGRSPTWLAAHASDPVPPDVDARFRQCVHARGRGEPIAYLVGEREFFGRTFFVDARVLIPRPETELLVEFACAHAPRHARVIDLGTGSGAIAVSIAAERPDLQVVAIERSHDAIAVARINAQRLAPQVRIVEGDWLRDLPIDERVEMIVANPPYIAADDPHLAQGDLRFEPRDALTDHADGLHALRAIVASAPRHLDRDGWLAVEHGYDQALAVRALFEAADYDAIASHRDLAGIERITVGRRRAASAE